MNEDDTITVTSPEEPPAPEKEEEVKASLAKIQAAEAKANVDKLSTDVMEKLTGVASQWLSGVKPSFDRLAALAMSDNVTDDDFLKVVEAAKVQLPELFDKLDTKVLQKAFEDSSGTALMAGVEDSLDK
jgi:hypothetical protein